MNRSIVLRARESIDKCVPLLQSFESRFQEFSDVIDLTKLVVHGLARYHWMFTSDEYQKLIHAMRIEDDYSRNVTLIGRQIKQYTRHPDLTISQKKFLDQLDYIIWRCLQDAIELFKKSERELIREGVKIYMSASDGYGEHERARAALWGFQEDFHDEQIDPSRGSDRAIIYPYGGFDINTNFTPGRNRNNNGFKILSDEEQAHLKLLLNRPDILRDLLWPNGNNFGGGQPPVKGDDGEENISKPVERPRKGPTTPPIGILKGSSFGFGWPPKKGKKVHFGDSNDLPLSPGDVFDGLPPLTGGQDNTIPKWPSKIVCSGPPTRTPTIPFCPPLSPPSPSSSESQTPPPTPPLVPVDITSTKPPNSPGDSTVLDDGGEEIKEPDDESPPSSPSSSTSSSSLPSVGSPSSTKPSSSTDEGDENSTASNSSEDKATGATLAPTEVEVRREVALSIRAYLGRRHNEYSMAMTKNDANDERDEALHLSHPSLAHTVRQRTARATHDVKITALSHWAGVTTAKREERIAAYTRLRTFLKWAQREGKVPLSPSSIRASTGLRRGLFEPLGPPDLPPPPRKPSRKGKGKGKLQRQPPGPGPYREATLKALAQMQPRLDLTLLAFLFNQDALRLFGGLVGEQPQPRDLARMDRVLRELEVYIAVCAHRTALIVGHLKRTREFPGAMPAQSGDLAAALQDAEEDQLSAARRCFNHVAERSRRVMTYPGRRVVREFGGSLGPQDRERLEYLGQVDEDAAALRAELEAAEGWLGWCRETSARWTEGWRPARVEADMLYVGEDVQADVRRYKWEINQKRIAIGLVPVRRTQDEVYERQQEHIRLLDRLWMLVR